MTDHATQPALMSFSHASLSVRDLAASTAWYCDILGFVLLEPITAATWIENVLVHPSGAVLSLQQHATNQGEPFDPTRTGMDHLAFRVAGRSDLDTWDAFLTERGVDHSAPIDEHYGSVLSLKDPDAVALELFWRENHP
ncbi:MAG TPA: VOC family protein [Acidimicrobiales bacterium]|nr:VOC family protein [Acidimicrobiales bacterium]